MPFFLSHRQLWAVNVYKIGGLDSHLKYLGLQNRCILLTICLVVLSDWEQNLPVLSYRDTTKASSITFVHHAVPPPDMYIFPWLYYFIPLSNKWKKRQASEMKAAVAFKSSWVTCYEQILLMYACWWLNFASQLCPGKSESLHYTYAELCLSIYLFMYLSI